VLGNEEVVEETGISPGNISKLLGETSGIMVQHTSAVSGNVSFRIQGLPGKYTQLLQDGFPMYSGFSSGLSLLQIPPLNLQQVEIIKGSVSTLYGGDAVAGIVNLISKIPGDKPELSVLFNQTTLNGRDVSSFYAGKNKKLSVTLLAGLNTHQAKDVSGNGFSDVPEYQRAVINPTVFYEINKSNHLTVGLFSTIEDRLGGDMLAIDDNPSDKHSFFEQNKTQRLNGRLSFEHLTQSGNVLNFRTSVSNFNRRFKTNTNIFSGIQNNVYSELSYFVKTEKHNWVTGINYYIDDFNEKDTTTLSYNHQTVGLFTQDNYEITERLFLEPGIRYDYNFKYGSLFLPRLAVMYHFTDNFFGRLSGGFGYKLPTPFTDEAERTRYQDVRPLNNLKPEKSTGVNVDINFKTPLFEELFLTFNQAFFLTELDNPIIANQALLNQQIVLYENAEGNISSRGLNSNMRLSLDELVLYVDYTFLSAIKKYDENKQLELTPKNRLTTTLAYEDEEEGVKAGLEAFYFGAQQLENGNRTPDYWLLGASVQKRFGCMTVALNIENILDIRQTRYENIVSGDLNNPVFNDIYAPLDGIVGNIVLKFDLY
jgi:iron complex outermembrane receptor protein